MKLITSIQIMVFFLVGLSTLAKAENALTQEELVNITKMSMDNYTANNPEHAKHISGFKTTTVNVDGKVVLSITHDGMTMNSTFFCVRQDKTFVCNEQ